MPVVELHVLEGYNPKEKQRLGQALTDATKDITFKISFSVRLDVSTAVPPMSNITSDAPTEFIRSMI